MSRRVLGIVGKSLVFLTPVILVGVAALVLTRADEAKTERQIENLRAAGRLQPENPRAPRLVGLTIAQSYPKLNAVGAQPDWTTPEGRRLPNVSPKWVVCTQVPAPGRLIPESSDGTHHVVAGVAKRC